MLRVLSPNGETRRSGFYFRASQPLSNGLPYWRKKDNKSLNEDVLYPMWNGQWGIASVLEFANGGTSLCYIRCPAAHQGRMPNRVGHPWMYWNPGQDGCKGHWVLDKEISVRVELQEAPRITVEQALDLEHELTLVYRTEAFQRKLHKLWNSAGGDPVLQKEARSSLLLPIQIEVLRKYGYEPSMKGVRDSLRDFRAFPNDGNIQLCGQIFDWQLNPDVQSRCLILPCGTISVERRSRIKQPVASSLSRSLLYQEK